MFKLYRKFKTIDWLSVVFIIGLTVLQVFFTMTLVDYMQGIIKSITYLNYQNNPFEISNELAMLVESLGGWENLKNLDFVISLGLPEEIALMITDVAKASVGDIWYNGGMMLLCALGTMAAQMVISVVASFVAANLSTRIRTDLYTKVSAFSLAEINQFSTPSLITRTTNDIQQVQMANLTIMRMIFAAPVTAIWALFKIQASSTELTIATAIAIVCLIIFIFAMMVVVLPKFKIMQKLTDRLNAVTRENLTGIRIVRAYNAEEYQEEKFDQANEDITKAQIFTGRVMSLMNPVMMIIMNGIALAIYWIGALLINQQKIDFATVTAFMALSSQIIMAFVMLMMMFVLWPRASISAQRINEVLEEKSKIIDPEEEKERTEIGTVEFKNVSFKYDDGENEVISNVSFKANKGDTVAFIGSTGSGKSTLINLVPRFYDVTEGEILIDGVNVKDLKQKTIHDLIGYVPQKGLLFRGTIRENIAFSNPDLSMDDVMKAAMIAEAHEFISKMDDGYDYFISQGGKNVSGGQKQRLCIARAIASKPEIMIFDDSFSALDYKTDKKIRENLKENEADITKLIVAQRIGTIMDANLIIVLDEGQMVGKGTHQELLKNCEVYREIALSQLSKEELGL